MALRRTIDPDLDLFAPTRASAGPAAGWYPDPERNDRHRYWNGTSWTTHVAPVAPVAADDLPRPRAEADEQDDAHALLVRLQRYAARHASGLVVSTTANADAHLSLVPVATDSRTVDLADESESTDTAVPFAWASQRA